MEAAPFHEPVLIRHDRDYVTTSSEFVEPTTIATVLSNSDSLSSSRSTRSIGHTPPIYSSSSSPSSPTTLKNFKLYSPLLVLTTRNQSLNCCFLRNFFVKYLIYLPLKSRCATISIFPSPRFETVMSSPRLPVRPSTLMRCWRNVVKAAGSKMRSWKGWVALMVYCAGKKKLWSAGELCQEGYDEGFDTFLVVFWPFFWPPDPLFFYNMLF